MSKFQNYYKDWGNPTPEMMADLDKLIKKFIATMEKQREEREKYPLFYWKENT